MTCLMPINLTLDPCLLYLRVIVVLSAEFIFFLKFSELCKDQNIWLDAIFSLVLVAYEGMYWSKFKYLS